MIQILFGLMIGCAHNHDHDVSLPTGDEANGESLYDAQCSACHGATADGGIGTSLLGQPDAHFIEAVQEGIGDMPALPDLTDQDIADIIAFVRTLEDE